MRKSSTRTKQGTPASQVVTSQVPLYIKTTLLFAEVIKNVFGNSIWDSLRKTAVVGYAQRFSRPILRKAEKLSRPTVRCVEMMGALTCGGVPRQGERAS